MSQKNLPTEWLRTLVTVARLGSITGAGELLGRSQPALSLQLKKLEALVGQSLLQRGGSRLELSDAGRLLFRYATEMLALNDEAIAQFEQPEVSGRVRFGVPSEFATTLLPKVVGRFVQTHPGVSLEVVCELSRNLLQQEQRNRYDLILALFDEPRGDADELVDQLVWVAGRNFEPRQHASLPLVLAPEPCIYRARGLQVLKAAQRSWHIVYTHSDLSGISAALREGLGVTVLARATVPEGLRILETGDWLPELGSVGIRLITQSQRADRQAVERLAEFVRAGLSGG